MTAALDPPRHGLRRPVGGAIDGHVQIVPRLLNQHVRAATQLHLQLAATAAPGMGTGEADDHRLDRVDESIEREAQTPARVLIEGIGEGESMNLQVYLHLEAPGNRKEPVTMVSAPALR